jgi:hypothetical protein
LNTWHAQIPVAVCFVDRFVLPTAVVDTCDDISRSSGERGNGSWIVATEMARITGLRVTLRLVTSSNSFRR